MVRRRQRERSLFEVLLPAGDKLWPDWLKRIDTLLEDEAVLDTMVTALEQRWRTGCEGRISVLKPRHGLRRSRYHGLDGMHRWVGLGVTADNLINVARHLDRRAAA